MLYGIMTGLNAFTFIRKVEDATAGRIDWSLTGSLGEPWPPDAWIEGNNGHGAMRVHCNDEHTEFPYTEYIRNNELLSDELASAVIAFLDRSLPTSAATVEQEAAMPYIVLWGAAYDLLADAIAANGGKVYEHYESIEEAGHDAPFTSVKRAETLFIDYEHPDSTRDRRMRLPVPQDAEAVNQTARQIVDFAKNPS